MSLGTPSHPRLSTPSAGGLRLTPSNSPYPKTLAARSPVKLAAAGTAASSASLSSRDARPELALALRRVIGTTAGSANAFASLPSEGAFAFTAGAAAVVASVDETTRHVSQRFYRARPTAAPVNPSSSVYGLSTPSNSSLDVRSRAANGMRDAGAGISPFGSPAPDWVDSPSRAWTARERIKAATCVSFSPDGKFLAVGETGYKPRVLIFSAGRDDPADTPLSCLSDHTFGVRCVAFSPDSQYLASLGSANDGFLYIWNVNNRTGAATLYASNKCTSNIYQMAWLGTSLVVVGTRHVKVWRVEGSSPAKPAPSPKPRQSDIGFALASPGHKTLPGRNCLLGALLESTFTSVAAIGQNKGVIGTDRGDLCVLDDSDGTQRISKVADTGFGITALSYDGKGCVHVAGVDGSLTKYKLEDILSAQTPPPSPSPKIDRPSSRQGKKPTHTVAIECLGNLLAAVDSRRSIQLLDMDSRTCPLAVVQKLPAHGTAVQGVRSLFRPNPFDASFYTWSSGGTVLFWAQDGICKGEISIELEQAGGTDEDPNELRTVRNSSRVGFLVSGDKYGVLRIIDAESRSCVYNIKAHASEITDIAIHEGSQTLIACCGRDRTVQIFFKKGSSWDLLQTLDEHVGAVNGILFSSDGNRLLSSSSDRTVVVREAISREIDGESLSAFIILRTITLKASPVSMALDSESENDLILSTIDRFVQRYDLRNGHLISGFKASDPDGGDAVVLSSLVQVPMGKGSPIIAGVSSTDKSIRLYDDAGTLLGRDWGHTEGVSDIALVSTKVAESDPDTVTRSLVTVAVDGTIFMWDVDSKTQQSPAEVTKSTELSGANPTPKDSILTRPPLRRVLSQSELARFQRSPGDESEVTTPTGSRSPRLRKRPSKFTLAQTPKLEPSPMLRRRGSFQAPSSSAFERKSYRNRSPSPPSPRNVQQPPKSRRHEVEARGTRSKGGEFGSLLNSTEQVCRTLRSYRKKLVTSSDALGVQSLRELERELGLTARALGEKAKSKGVDEAIMAKMLDQYSERLVEMLDEKIAATVARQVRQNSEYSEGGTGSVTT
ncbi:WD domain-containing protein, partial [Lineolata rhizophorae]